MPRPPVPITPTGSRVIETSMPGGVTHRTTIWAIVDGDDVFVRSYVGADARWYREAVANLVP